MTVESDVLEIIKPTKEETEHINRVAESLMSEVRKYIEENKIDAEPRYVGSVAKGTNLRDPDLDLFLIFPLSTPIDEVSRIGVTMGEKLIEGKRMYCEHPYTTGVYQGLEVDMVPCYHIATTEKIITAVDRSPFHAEYVKAKTDPALCDEIRLMKRFMKGIGTYGAEPDVRGFSGYMCELITIYYGGFIKTLEAASKWKEGTEIVLEKRGPDFVSALVLYDPVDAKRNVASAVHIDTLCEFITASRAYLANPSIKFFFPEKRKAKSEEELRLIAERHGSRIVVTSFNKPDVNEDNLHAQVWKTHYAIEKKLNANMFNVIRGAHMTTDENIVLAFELETDKLSKTHKHFGPPVWVKTAKDFVARWEGNENGQPFIEEGKWAVVADRLFTDPYQMLKKEAPRAGIGKDVHPDSMIYLDHESAFRPEYLQILTELLCPCHRWEIE